MMNVVVWFLFICVFYSMVQAQNCKSEIKCKIGRTHGMKSADCYKKDIRAFPQCLPQDIEIIYLSMNRVRKLNRDDLSKYSDLQMLYLHDNAIVSIDEEAFTDLNALHTLDLSLNSLSKVPLLTFHLPSLKTLYLGQNLNINIVEIVDETKPITSPLVHLDLSYTMTEEYSVLPELGLLPLLVKYNISGNKLEFLRTAHFSGLCSLKYLDSTNVSVTFDKPCECWTINRWLKTRMVQFQPFDCDVKENECWDSVPEEDLELFKKCQMEVNAIIEKSRMLKILIPVIVIGGLLLLGIVICVLRRRRRRRQRLVKKLEAEQKLYES